MATFRSLAAAAAAITLVQNVNAWTVSLPPCLEPFQPFVYSGCYKDLNNPDTLSFRSPLDTQSMTIEKCIAECKGNGYRYAGLEYYGECYCGATVNGPMVDNSQCTFPCTGNNTQVCGGNDLISIYQDPTFPAASEPDSIEDYKNLGCHTDDASQPGKSLAYPVNDVTGQPWDRATGTTSKCLQACKSKGFPFAGTEYGGECYCGVVIGNGTQLVDMKECNMPCLGNNTENCGGPSRINIYVSKDLMSLEPCGYHPPVSSSTTSTAPPTTSTTAPPTTYPPTTTRPPTTTPPSSTTKTSTSVCVTTTVIPPKCEYGCGSWCSHDLPDWHDTDGCNNGHSNCKMQIAACFKNAGWPGSMDCFGFSKWCVDIDHYCKKTPKNKCSKSDCFKQKPPKGGPGKPTTSTITIPCKPTSTKATSTKPTSTRATSTTTKCPVPTVTNICKQPTSWTYGYWPGNPVGGVELPVVTCNDLKKEFNSGKQLKLYIDSDSRKCPSFPHWQAPEACKRACKEQYDDCQAVYSQGCKKNEFGTGTKAGNSPWRRQIAGRGYWTDPWPLASKKCTAQYNDCLQVNMWAAANGKCGWYGGGW